MASPRTAITRTDLSFTYNEFSLMAEQNQFIGLKVCPPAIVAKQSGTFSKLEVSSVLAPVEDTVRAPGGTYNRAGFQWTTDTFATDDHGAEEVLDDRQLGIYANELRAEQVHRDRAAHRVLLAYENEVASTFFNTSTWTGASLTTGVSVAWTTPATAAPLADIDAAYEIIAAKGIRPNTLILSDYAWRALVRTDQITGLLKYSGNTDPASLLSAKSTLCQIMGIDQILIGRGMKPSTGLDDNTSTTTTRLWTKTMAMLCAISTTSNDNIMDAEPCIGRTFMWAEENAAVPGAEAGVPSLIVEEYREEGRRGGVIRARCDYQVKTLHVAAGHLLTNVAA